MPKIIFLTDHHVDIYKWRKELIFKLLEKEYEVVLALPYGEMIDNLTERGCKFVDVKIDRRGKNIFKDLILLKKYVSVLRSEKPDCVLTYGTKPNIYGGMVCRLLGVNYIENINGLGSAVGEKEGLITRLMIFLYKRAIKKANCVFYQNTYNKAYFDEHKIFKGKNRLIPGSGVNVDEYVALPFPKENPCVFTFIARIMKEKGIDEFLGAAKILKGKYLENVQFNVLGECEEDYKKILADYQSDGIIVYHGMQKEVKKFIEKSHCIVMPSYYGEGMSNSLLESASSARAVITTGMPGCGEIVDNAVTGFVVDKKNIADLSEKMECFLKMENSKREEMGAAGRQKMISQFDRNIVVGSYLEEIELLHENS